MEKGHYNSPIFLNCSKPNSFCIHPLSLYINNNSQKFCFFQVPGKTQGCILIFKTLTTVYILYI